MPRTRRADPSRPGIARRRRGRGFAYLDARGARVEDPDTLARIAALAIPPAWREVWICDDPRGHIQATGIDDAGRKQYRYHEDWRARRDAQKFDRMIEFARVLPWLRRHVARDLGRRELDERRACAAAVRLLDVGLFRIGNEDYAERNASYGLTTLRKDHVRIERDGTMIFDFPAKSGQRRLLAVQDPKVLEIVRVLRRRRGGGEDLLAFKREGRWVDLRAEDVNAYLKTQAGEAFSAKDFRTWNATALCAVALALRAGDAASRTARGRVVNAALDDVAAFLGNTRAVCRSSYVDPRVIDRFGSGLTIGPDVARAAGPVDERVRRAVLDLLAGDRDSEHVERLPRAA